MPNIKASDYTYTTKPGQIYSYQMPGLAVKVVPIDYRKALEKMRRAEHRDTETTPATEEVFYG